MLISMLAMIPSLSIDLFGQFRDWALMLLCTPVMIVGGGGSLSDLRAPRATARRT